jgi:hypothetical protein
MGEYDFERFHEILKSIDATGFEVRKKPTIENMRRYHSLMWQLYTSWKSIIGISDIFDAEFARVDMILFNIESDIEKAEISRERGRGFSLDGVKILETRNQLIWLNEELYAMKQFVGLGINVSKEKSAKAKLRGGLV